MPLLSQSEPAQEIGLQPSEGNKKKKKNYFIFHNLEPFEKLVLPFLVLANHALNNVSDECSDLGVCDDKLHRTKEFVLIWSNVSQTSTTMNND